jgi:hypothetical protein
VVLNDKGAVVGQLASNGLNVTFSAVDNVTIILPIRDDLNTSGGNNMYTTAAMAYVL